MRRQTVLRLAGSVIVAGGLLVPLSSSLAAAPSSCSWGAKSDPDTVNAAYPDTDASYWSYRYAAAAGTELVVHGTYPKARYFSFHAYDPSGVPVDSIYDVNIAPDRGSANPFTGPAAGGRPEHYTVYVQFTAPPAHRAANTVYAGATPIQGAPNPGGLFMMRVYVPVDPTSPAGGVPLPTVTLQTTSGDVIQSDTACSNDLPSTGGAINGAMTTNDFPVATSAAASAPELTWKRAAGNPYAGAFGNQQNAYMTATISRNYGDLVVIHAKAPTFPDTSAGQPTYRPTQLRYWSICENSTDTRVILCAADYQAHVKNGYYTYVISDPSNRPKTATAANGVAWLPWGATDATALLIYRNMVPAAGFSNAAQNVAKTADPVKVMGVYYPKAAYCTAQLFDKGGWKACFAG